jgi:cation diffusion facilitator family transporter
MSRTTRLWIVLALNLVLVTALVFVGIAAHSLGVFGEGADYFADAAAIGLTLFALGLSARPRTRGRPFGHPKASAWVALVNAGLLLAVTLLVATDAIDRLVTGAHHVDGLAVLIVSGVAAAVMVLGSVILGGGTDPLDDGDPDDLGMRAVLLDTAADAVAAAGVAIAGAVIAITGGTYWLDPAVALVVSCVVAYHAIQFLRKVIATVG